ncbi:MAG: B12-binding domain-containing radical SAM protein [Bacteroidetes bacterium]|nr:B12-binding domain-containing radical SAM protein [Bacteroidota bacterium]
MGKVLLFNPRSANHSWRIPNSILQVAASIEDKWDYALVDGNRERDPWEKIQQQLDTGTFSYFGCTVMPGPQLKQAIPFTKQVKESYPRVTTVWGGYFPSNQYRSCLNSGYVDFIIDGPGDFAFPRLLECLEKGEDCSYVPNLIYRKKLEIVRTQKESIPDQDLLPQLPYERLNSFYPIKGYLGKSYLGQRTAAYHSSMGCPFTCSFCAVVPIYNARWKGRSARLVYKDIKYLIDTHGADAVEFHDNNFFVNEKRTVDFSKLILQERIAWWGEGRIDTVDKYKDESLALMREAGCKMIFFGAETGSQELLRAMDKGGMQTPDQMKRFAERLRKFDIIPEYSFVLGFPGPSAEKVMEQIENEIAFIKEVKRINPDTEIIIYVYSPVPTEGSDLYEQVKESGFRFPEKLDDWLSHDWQTFDLRKNPLTPWLKPYMVDKIKDFETVLNARYPTVADFKLTRFQKLVMKKLSGLRYQLNFFAFPYELKILQKFWLRYRQPEVEGFFMEHT